MKKITSVLLIVLTLVLISSALTVGVGASSAYQTYTYSINGEALYSPDAYNAVKAIDAAAMGLEKSSIPTLKNANDITTDEDDNVYIVDTGNHRVIVLDPYYRYKFEIATFRNDQGNPDALSKPQGVFVRNGEIWVCDTGNCRLVVFDAETGAYKALYRAPESDLIESDEYTPVALAIDQYGRLYVVSSTTYQGIIVLNGDGSFVGFIGAQQVTISAWDIIWKKFQTDEQKKLSANYVSTEYNNIAINEDGFIYVTSDSIAKSSISSAIKGKSKNGKYMPVKLLNPAGDEIMRRNGFWPPAGEVAYETVDGQPAVSKVTDVATGPERTWTIIDFSRSKLFTYDYNGNLLFAFGDIGGMLGSITQARAVVYQGTTLLVLDSGADCITVYERTEYGDLLLEAIAAENSLDYNYAIDCWERVLQRNCNFDAAYVGIGSAYYRSGDYQLSLEYYEKAYDTANWSESYKEVRKDWMSDWFLLLIAIIIILIVLVVKFFTWAGKVNKRVATDGKERKTFGQELLYGFYVIFHPFDGFYDLKHEHRGSIRASLVFLVLTIIAFFYQGIGQGYVLNPTRATTTIWAQMISVLVPVLLFVIANWCLTTLFEGEGSLKDIFIAACYSLLPLIILIIPATIASNWVSSTEASLITMFTTIALIWVGILLFFGTMVTHDYSLGKNFITILGTIVAMAFIIFIVLLFSMLLSKLVGLVTNIITELQFRV